VIHIQYFFVESEWRMKNLLTFLKKKKDHIGVSRCAAIFAHVKQYCISKICDLKKNIITKQAHSLGVLSTVRQKLTFCANKTTRIKYTIVHYTFALSYQALFYNFFTVSFGILKKLFLVLFAYIYLKKVRYVTLRYVISVCIRSVCFGEFMFDLSTLLTSSWEEGSRMTC